MIEVNCHWALANGSFCLEAVDWEYGLGVPQIWSLISFRWVLFAIIYTTVSFAWKYPGNWHDTIKNSCCWWNTKWYPFIYNHMSVCSEVTLLLLHACSGLQMRYCHQFSLLVWNPICFQKLSKLQRKHCLSRCHKALSRREDKPNHNNQMGWQCTDRHAPLCGITQCGSF